MTDSTPPGGDAPEPTQPIRPAYPAAAASPPPAVESSESNESTEPPRRGGRRLAVIGGVTAAVLVVGGVGAFAAMRSLGGSDPAESALPAGTLASLSLDLDPGASQKIEAIKTFRKFPALRDNLKIGSGDDLREKFFTQALKDCDGVTYAEDVEPWIGKNAALGAVSFGGDTVAPVVALGVTDEDGARTGLKKLSACADDGDDLGGIAFSGDFAVLSDTQKHADTAAQRAGEASLADDEGFKRWTGKAGARGIMSFYLAKAGATYLGDHAADLLGSGSGGFAFDDSLSGGGASAPHSAASADDPSDQLKKALAGFKGAGGTLRFADSGLELSAIIGARDTDLPTVGDVAGGLPDDTAAAVVAGYPDDYAATLLENLEPQLEGFGLSTSVLEDQLGLSLPEDLQTLLGEGIALTLADQPVALDRIEDPTDVPAGLTIKGDPDAITTVLDKVQRGIGFTLEDAGITLAEGEDTVNASFVPAYAKALAAGGDLGSDAKFTAVVPEAKKSSLVLYADLDSGWLKTIAASMSGQDATEFAENTEPLDAFGTSYWNDGVEYHVLAKVTTD